nr:hypothetical protein [Tanacetum cinerariifolium]
MYYGHLQEILEYKYLLFKVVLFRVKWFDTRNQGCKVKHLVLRNSMTQIDTRGEAFKNDQYILVTQVKQVFYLEDKAKPHLKVVEHVNHKKNSDGGVIVVEDDPDIIHFDNSSDLPLFTSFNDLDNATLHIDGQSTEVDIPPDIIDVVDEDDDIIDDEGTLPHDLTDSDDEDLINFDDDGVDNVMLIVLVQMSANVARSHDGDSGGEDRPPPHHVPTGCGVNSLNDSPSISENSSQSPPHINHHCCYECGDPLEVPIIPDPEPFNNQTIKELPPTVPSFDSKSDLVHDSPNVLIHLRNFLYFLVTHEAYQCQPKNQDYYHEQNSCYDSNSFGFDQFQPQQYTANHPVFNVQNDLFDSQNKFIEKLTSMCDMIPACYDDDDDDYAFAITPNKPINSLSMGDEHLDTIPTTESDEFIKYSVENLVPNPSESEGESECDVPTHEEFTTFSNILFDSNYDSYSSDDQSFSDEDLPKEIYLNPLFDEEIIPMKIDPHHFNVESDLIESMLNHDSSIIISSKIDSLFDEFAGELTLLKSIPPRIDETDCYPKEETHFIKRLLYDNSSPRPPEEFISKNSNVTIESFSPSPILVEDSDSSMEEINLSFILDYPMSPGIEEDNYDSEKDILILDELHSNDSLSLPEYESFHFDIPSFTRPPAKPPDGNTGLLNVKIMGDISEQKVLMPKLMITLVPNKEKSPDLLSH